ncbi:BrnT family toxin [Maritimibacter fusiformis]|uniref:BrnT family toxin n=1 Tax=Maritimibacter fusiformis TaxID=2603819 RepID=A0A5D0R7M1_9RHOB|nr:BrnT family toxin [Maritimibacter fusiformis]TYB76836.1 BrnT family toxin [Maritimibacter fusiformis]
MKIEYDPAKRDTTLEVRGLDMADAMAVFDGPHLTVEDDRRDYGETRNLTIGFLAGRLVVMAWTPRQGAIRVISMRKANEREKRAYGPRLEQ